MRSKATAVDSAWKANVIGRLANQVWTATVVGGPPKVGITCHFMAEAWAISNMVRLAEIATLGANLLAGGSSLSAGLMQIRPAGHKHGSRRYWRELEFAQLAIQALYPGGVSRDINQNDLGREVNEWLRRNHDWRALGISEGVSQSTVARALVIVLEFDNPECTVVDEPKMGPT
jgi:hypothetical protein